ncbi:MAG: ethanolamine ammonia-lyase reactivating factor EutA [Betaproteobacteria bacterium]
MNIKRLHSVGIDVGTTTTQVIFSALEVTNRAPVNQVPRYEFSKREILYQSPVIFTPLTPDRTVDVAQLLSFIDAQYASAGVTRKQIESGAIIITGETSKTGNARAAVMEVSGQLGDFVVATAGPHLESIISGRGSGAAEYSRANAARVLNIDIGGGTSNYAIFAGGKAIDSACLNVGGHLIETDTNGKVTRVHQPARLICDELFGRAQDPMQLTRAQLDQVAIRMAELVVEVMRNTPSPLAQALLMTAALSETEALDTVFISGGVGACLYQPGDVATPFVYRDIGPLLADALKPLLSTGSPTLAEPQQTVRATVIGAGAHTLSLSGSTIWVNANNLPIKNLPVAHPLINAVSGLGNAWGTAVRQLDLDPACDAYALALPASIEPLYRNIVATTDELVTFCRQSAPTNVHPLIVICPQDLGKALGMELQPHMMNRQMAIIDEVQTREGDYLDIGLPIFDGNLLPITVKSLAFPS